MDTFRHEIALYLNDHLAGATAGVELADRIAREHENPALAGLARDIREDRESLRRIMTGLDAQQDLVKIAAGWLSEKVGRLKLNGHLFAASPLSYVVDLEALRLAVDGNAAGWQTLRALADHNDQLDRVHLDELLARSEAQRQTLEALRGQAVAEVFAEPEAKH
jgi:hypothetical protein